MKINYVISTYAGRGKRTHSHPLPKNVLKAHIDQLSIIDNNLSQITIMKPKSEIFYNEYYAIEEEIKTLGDVVVKIVECENYGYSPGQFLKAFEILVMILITLFLLKMIIAQEWIILTDC